jgi:hypothetical protein
MIDKEFESQFSRAFHAFHDSPKTTKMVSVETGIPRENLTRYVAELERQKRITTVKKAPCKITKREAKYYSTDKKLFPPETQPDLFPKERVKP